MPRPWQPGRGRRYLVLGLTVVTVLGVGWAFGTRVLTIRDVRMDLIRLTREEARVHEEISTLRLKLAAAGTPQAVEEEARRQLRWGFPDEERIVLIRR